MRWHFHCKRGLKKRLFGQVGSPPLRGRDYAYVPIWRHLSPYVPICPNLVKRRTTHLSKHISKTLQNLCFQAQSARVSPKKVKEKRYEKLY